MTRQLSFNGHERKILPQFRAKKNKAESTEEVRKFFIQTVQELLQDVLDERGKVKDEDVGLLPYSEPFYKISNRLRTDQGLKTYLIYHELSDYCFEQGAGQLHPGFFIRG